MADYIKSYEKTETESTVRDCKKINHMIGVQQSGIMDIGRTGLVGHIGREIRQYKNFNANRPICPICPTSPVRPMSFFQAKLIAQEVCYNIGPFSTRRIVVAVLQHSSSSSS